MCALFDSPELAQAAVREFNAARGGNEFQKSVERSRERVLALMPNDPVRASDISDGDTAPKPTGKMDRLMKLLEREAKKTPCPLDRIEELCADYELDWKWVERKLESLSNSGTLIFPRPWSVLLVTAEERNKANAPENKDISSEILAILFESEGPIKIEKLIELFQDRGVSEDSVLSSLERLMQNGEIFEPRSGIVKLV